MSLITLIFILALGLSCSDDSDDPAPVLSTATDILSFSFTEETGAATINSSNHTIDVEVSNGTELTNLSPTFTLSVGATSDPASGTSGNYSSEVTISVTAEDGTTIQAWTVNVSEASGGGGETTVEFAEGGTDKATAIRNLVVDGVTYDVEFKHAYPQQIYGDYPGTYTFISNTDASAAIMAIDDALNSTDATTVGEKDKVDDDRYRIGVESIELVGTQNTRFRSGVFDTSWLEGFGDSVFYNNELNTWAVFTEL